jgi:hypothetical protein
MATPSKGASMGEQTENGNGTLLTEIDLLRVKNGQMAEESNVQKATIEQQTKEVK